MSVKKLKGAYERYLKSDMDTLYKAYASPSCHKVDAWENRCRGTMLTFGGHDLKVVSHNCSIFTAGFLFEDAFKNQYFYYITPTNRYCVSVRSLLETP